MKFKGDCPCVGVLCFLVAFMASLFATPKASADPPATAIKGTPLVVPATVLGISNPYVIRAAAPTPDPQKFLLRKDIRDLADRVDHLARYGLDLNQGNKGPEKLQLSVHSRFGGGVIKLSYRH